MNKKKNIALIKKASDMAFQNAVEYHKDAVILFDNDRNPGHTYVLCVLAEEELAKSFWYHWVCELLRKDLTFIRTEKAKGPTLLRIHEFKQQWQSVMWKLMVALYVTAMEGKINPNVMPSKEDFESFVTRLENEDFSEDVLQAFKKIDKRYNEMQRNKEVGMYVDIKNGEVIGLDDFPRQRVEEELMLTLGSFEIVHAFINAPLTKHHVKLLEDIDAFDIFKEGIYFAGLIV